MPGSKSNYLGGMKMNDDNLIRRLENRENIRPSDLRSKENII